LNFRSRRTKRYCTTAGPKNNGFKWSSKGKKYIGGKGQGSTVTGQRWGTVDQGENCCRQPKKTKVQHGVEKGKKKERSMIGLCSAGVLYQKKLK